MSRKISIQEKKKWLELFEQGQTENQIAIKEKRDLRTIVRGLQEASRDRHLANAEAEMLRNALFTHQDKLMNLLKSIANMLVLPDVNLALREDENGLLAPISLSGSLVEMTPEKQITLRIHDEEKLEWELLQEHLKSDKLWNYLKRWREAIIDHIEARWKFKQSIKTILGKKTELKFKKQNEQMAEYLSPNIIDLFYEVKMHNFLGVKDGTDVEHNLEAHDGYVRFHTTELARCTNDKKCRDKIIAVFNSLLAIDEALKVKQTYSELTTVTRLARRQVDEILLLGMVMGKCRVCARLGK